MRRKNLSKKDPGREKKKLSCGEDKWRNEVTARSKMKKSTDSDYEEFINKGSKSAEKTTMKGRIVENRY